MLGRYNRQKYIIENDLMDPEYNPSQFKILSTPFSRTIMSGYSELLGLFPPKSRSVSNLVEKHEPPMKLRVSRDGYLPIDEITMVPVFSHLS